MDTKSTVQQTEATQNTDTGSGRICVFVEQNKDGSCKSLGLELLTPALEIFGIANCGIVADLFQIVPELQTQMEQLL